MDRRWNAHVDPGFRTSAGIAIGRNPLEAGCMLNQFRVVAAAHVQAMRWSVAGFVCVSGYALAQTLAGQARLDLTWIGAGFMASALLCWLVGLESRLRARPGTSPGSIETRRFYLLRLIGRRIPATLPWFVPALQSERCVPRPPGKRSAYPRPGSLPAWDSRKTEPRRPCAPR